MFFFEVRCDVPRQQLLDAVDRMLGDAPKHVAQVRFGIEPIELGRLHQAVDRGGALAARVRAEEEVVLAAKAHAAQRSLGRIVVDLDAPVLAVARERLPVRKAVADGLREVGLGRDCAQLLAQYQYNFISGTLAVGKLPVKITPNNTAITAGEDLEEDQA